MKKALLAFALACLPLPLLAQWTTIEATKITDGRAANHMLTSGKICFLGVDANGAALGFEIAGGGQNVKTPYCATVTNGVGAALSVPDAALTAPVIAYKIIVNDGHSDVRTDITQGGIVSGSSWNYDNYIPSTGNVANSASVENLKVRNLCFANGTCQSAAGSGSGSGTVSVNGAIVSAGSSPASGISINGATL
jgi:hypothetical protein